MSATVFLVSPASCAGRRTEILLSERAAFPLAVQLRADGAQLGEAFSFLSGLYFRGTDVLLEVFGDHLLFPERFIGRGDMSRGGLMLRAVDEGEELPCIAVRGAARRGLRPPKLAPRERR